MTEPADPENEPIWTRTRVPPTEAPECDDDEDANEPSPIATRTRVP